MRDGRIIIILVWATCSALCAGSMVYLGSNIEPFSSQWPLASGIGAAVGTVAALVVVRAWGNRGGLMLLEVVFGFVQAVALSVLWPGAK